MIDRFTDYRTRYGYPMRSAFWAEVWWRLEHFGKGWWRDIDPIGDREVPRPLLWLWLVVYRRRKKWERIGWDQGQGANLRAGLTPSGKQWNSP